MISELEQNTMVELRRHWQPFRFTILGADGFYIEFWREGMGRNIQTSEARD